MRNCKMTVFDLCVFRGRPLRNVLYRDRGREIDYLHSLLFIFLYGGWRASYISAWSCQGDVTQFFVKLGKILGASLFDYQITSDTKYFRKHGNF